MIFTVNVSGKVVSKHWSKWLEACLANSEAPKVRVAFEKFVIKCFYSVIYKQLFIGNENELHFMLA